MMAATAVQVAASSPNNPPELTLPFLMKWNYPGSQVYPRTP